jgi:hypothetical protein
MDQVFIKYTNIFHCKTLPNLPKLKFFGLKTNHLATQIESVILFFQDLPVSLSPKDWASPPPRTAISPVLEF